MKVAILTVGNTSDTGGIMSFVCEEARQIANMKPSDMSLDVFMVRERYSILLSLLLRLLKGYIQETPNDFGKNTTIVDGVEFNNIWIKEGVLSFFVRTRITHRPFGIANTKTILNCMKKYDYLLTHKTGSQYIGLQLRNKYNIPFGAFWHGSELAVTTFSDKHAYGLTKEVLEKSHDNFFVSQALLKIGEGVYKEGNNHVIYTGPSDMFYKYDEERKKELRARKGVCEGEIVIAYVGSLISIKNVLALPSIFRAIREKCLNEKVKFWIIGTGDLESELSTELSKLGIQYEMFGKIPQDIMPDYMNCIDILLLISKKEGLGLVSLEAIKCGAQVFGSLVGGIPEVIGEDRCVSLSDSFAEDISELVINAINGGLIPQTYDERFSWGKAAQSIVNSIRS